MNTAYSTTTDLSFFSDAQEQLDTVITELKSKAFANREHGDVERHINNKGHEIMRRLLQGHLNLLAANEATNAIVTGACRHLINDRLDITGSR